MRVANDQEGDADSASEQRGWLIYGPGASRVPQGVVLGLGRVRSWAGGRSPGMAGQPSGSHCASSARALAAPLSTPGLEELCLLGAVVRGAWPGPKVTLVNTVGSEIPPVCPARLSYSGDAPLFPAGRECNGLRNF